MNACGTGTESGESMTASPNSELETSATPDQSATEYSNSESTSDPATASTSPDAARRSSSSSAAATREASAETSSTPSESLLTNEELGLTPEDFITTPWDPIEHWDDDLDMAYALSIAFESDDRQHRESWLADAARAVGKTELVRHAATGPQTLHDALAELDRPSPHDVLKLLNEFDLHLLPKPERLPLPELAVAEAPESAYAADAG